ncbi:MAG: ribonuclease III [Myxococcales bacterium]|nr:ribonuclease III [Myxococcales bacterium]
MSRSRPPQPDSAAYQRLYDLIGHAFEDETRLVEALTHPSFRNETPNCIRDNQRLEFLGDSVVGLAVAAALYEARPDAAEGVLTTIRARVVSEPVLAAAARQAGIGPALRLGRGVVAEGGADRDSVVSDAFEAVVGAVFLDAGGEVARALVLRLLSAPIKAAVAAADSGDGLTEIHRHARNWKTAAQEALQSKGGPPPSYVLVGSEGPAHDRTFVVEATAHFEGSDLAGKGTGRTKKSAEHAAAQALLDSMVAPSPDEFRNDE